MALLNIDPKDIFFEKILQEGLDENHVNIRNVELIEQSDEWNEKAQNFYSNITRFTLKYMCIDDASCQEKEKHIMLILKEEPSEGPCLMQVRKAKFFETEITILGKIVPKIEKFIKIKITPQFIYGCKKKSLIIMENLTPRFVNKNCKLGFSKAHVLMMIESLAKFHAGSVALNEQEPGILPRFNRYDLNNETPINIFKNIEFCTRAIGQVISSLPNENCVQTAPKFIKIATQISESLLNLIEYDADEFCVLNHGDCWTNNIMFHENSEGEPLDVRLIDFQISVWSSPAIDLLFFLGICPELNIKYKLDDYFIEQYLNILTTTMKSIGCKTIPPTIHELKSSMYKRRSFAVKCGLIFYSKLVAGDDHVETIDDILEKGCSDMAIFNHPETIKVLNKVIPLMDSKGYLD